MDSGVSGPNKGPIRRIALQKLPILYKWEGPFEGWARKWVQRNFWRVRAVVGSEEDAMQECALVFARCVARYGTTVNNPAHMMALFKISVAREFHTLSSQDSAHREHLKSDVREEVDVNEGPLLAAIAEASAEARLVLHTVATAPSEFLALLLDNSAGSSDEALNRRFRRLLRISSARDIVAELRAILS